MRLLVSGSHPHHLHAPKRAGDVGYDLVLNEFKAIPPLTTATLRTGVQIKIPDGYWAEIKARSSTINRYGMIVISDVIDAGYTGEITVRVHNVAGCRMCVTEGMRIAQLVFHKAELPPIEYVHILPKTERGAEGLGSTGT